MILPGLESLRQKPEDFTQFINWLAEKVRTRNWVALLMLCFVAAAVLLNPVSIKALYPWLMGQELPEDFLDGYPWVYGVLLIALFLSALILAIRAKAREQEISPIDLSERSAVKGLWSFTYEDADLFKRLGRTDSLRKCLDNVTHPEFRFGVLSGESGCGKTSFLQAGLWPGLESRGFRCLYVKLTERNPLAVIRQALARQTEIPQAPVNELDVPAILEAAAGGEPASSDNKGVVLVLDQFEQFFVHQRYKADRQPFLEALAAWYGQSGHPVRLLISICKDYVGHLYELQEAMGYSLGPNESFYLEKFEPREAASVLRVMAKTEALGFDEEFAQELTAQELASPRDGLVSPVDLQILTWMIKAQKGAERKAFDRSTYQKLGGIEQLLERFLQQVLQARETEARRQAAVKVLLALVDLESSTRAGVLTLSDLQCKLSGLLRAEEAKEAVHWLSRGDIRLVTARHQKKEPGYELAHERLIPALRRLAGKTLSEADKANQLLDRRVNEWMGNQRAARYLLRWRELRLIQKQHPYLVWGSKRAQKEVLIAKSRQRRNGGLAAAGMMAVIAVSLTTLYYSDRGQIWLMERDLRLLAQQTRDPALLKKSALAFFASNHVQRLWRW
ncbi:ATP-binding protein [Nitrosococcus oceani]|uniref:ATP-binding protein n=1 Tax=Nitrosococcus oceani TaxID=1229 RepID=UPI000A423597|nr:ATP-binding protein [Nitrosococcus oceani]